MTFKVGVVPDAIRQFAKDIALEVHFAGKCRLFDEYTVLAVCCDGLVYFVMVRISVCE